jgi:hypothetical protein
MQPLMYDQPQPTCGRIENDSTERGGTDHHRPQKDCLAKPPVWIGREHFPILLARILASPSSLSRLHGRPSGVSTLPDGVIDLKQGKPGLTLAPIVMFTASAAIKRPRRAEEPAGFNVPFLAPILLDAAEVA